MHSTSNLEDGYMGSGKRLRYSIRKHGKENHTKEILEFFDSRELLIEAEKKAITPEMLVDVNCMNLQEGGGGGFCDDSHQLKCSIAGAKQHLIKLQDDVGYYNNWINKKRISGKKAYDEGRLTNPRGMFKDKHHSVKSKLLIGEANSVKQLGESNSQYGTCWIMKDGTSKKIKKEVLVEWIKNGWILGRKIK